jgi:undecaprenyl phosphate-alpha-L-ara4N flippase subunit ArnF
MSAMSSRQAISLVLLSVVLTSCAQLLFRYSMQGLSVLENLSHSGAAETFSAMTRADLFMLATGIACYAISMISWIFALSRFAVSLAYPLLSISYVLVYVGAITLPGLNESASWFKLLGIMVIAIGVAFVSLGDKRAAVKSAAQ